MQAKVDAADSLLSQVRTDKAHIETLLEVAQTEVAKGVDWHQEWLKEQEAKEDTQEQSKQLAEAADFYLQTESCHYKIDGCGDVDGCTYCCTRAALAGKQETDGDS